jgi:predicted anti-sigma-YlaC factor YlaD
MTVLEFHAARSDAGHLFVCPACRAEARLAAAWRDVSRSGLAEVPVEPEPRFIGGVVASVRRDRARRRRVRLALAAAAALLFFFFAGTGHETAARPAGLEASYASIVSPNALEGLIPN